jgi:hypothetical protein
LVFFDNSLCLACGSELGYDPATRSMIALVPDGDQLAPTDGSPGRYRRCANQLVARCNWLVPADDVNRQLVLCASCRLTSVRPNDTETDALAGFADAESAKRRLLQQLFELGLPVVSKVDDPDGGVTFELLSSRGRSVTTGHQGGVITLDLSESDDAHREFVRQQLGEPYRTVLGHLRHEIAHHYWPSLVASAGHLDEFRELFGDERVSYQDALQQHYDEGTPAAWGDTHVSQYATAHPWEDWAETFAHYLHIHGGLQTADSFGITVGEPSASAGGSSWSAPHPVAIGPTVGRWLAMTFALNAMSRSIGQGDLYPFVLSPAVVAKLDFVHRTVEGAAGRDVP